MGADAMSQLKEWQNCDKLLHDPFPCRRRQCAQPCGSACRQPRLHPPRLRLQLPAGASVRWNGAPRETIFISKGWGLTSGYIVITIDREVATFALFGKSDLSALSAVPPQVVP